MRFRSSMAVHALQAAPSAALTEESQGFSNYSEPEIGYVRPLFSIFILHESVLFRVQARKVFKNAVLGIFQVDFNPSVVNSVGLIGRLGTPFQLRRINDKYTVATSNLAVSRGSKKDGQESQTDWQVFLSCRPSLLQRALQLACYRCQP